MDCIAMHIGSLIYIFYLGCPDICTSLEYEPDFSDTGII